MIELVEEKHVKGSIGYLNEKAKENGFANWTEYYKYQMNKKKEMLIQEKERKEKERNILEKEKREKKQKKLYQNKVKINSRLRLVDLINLDNISEHINLHK